MWIKNFSISVLVIQFFFIWNLQAEVAEAFATEDKNVCVYASSSSETIRKLSNYFKINLDKIERQGIDFYFLISDNSIEFAFQSMPKNFKEPMSKIAENIFFVPSKKIYIGIKSNKKDKQDYIWLEKSKALLFKDYEMIGHTIKNNNNCLDPTRIKQIYEERKREVEYGPEPSGEYIKK